MDHTSVAHAVREVLGTGGLRWAAPLFAACLLSCVSCRLPAGTLGRIEPLPTAGPADGPSDFVTGAARVPVQPTQLGVPAWGSFVDGDAWTGKLVTPWYRAPESFFVWVSGYPTGEGNFLTVEFRDHAGSVTSWSISVDPGDRWEPFAINAPDVGPSDVRLAARDGHTGVNGWLGVSAPFVRRVDAIGAFVDAATDGLVVDHSGYTRLAWIALGALAAWLILQPPGHSAAPLARVACSRGVHAFLILFVFVAIRWPYAAEGEFNPDESQELGEAIKLFHDPRWWVAVDGYTHGPVVSAALTVPALLGRPLSYGNGRWLGVLLWVATSLLLTDSLRAAFGARAARIATFPFVVAMATMNQVDYVAFNCEHLVVFLLALACCAAARMFVADARAAWAVVAGLALGLVPYAKLQGVPIALAIGASITIALFVRADGSILDRLRSRALVGLVGGALLPTALVVIFLLAWGGLSYFWRSYLVWNLSYATRGSMSFDQAMQWAIQTSLSLPHVLPLTTLAIAAWMTYLLRQRGAPATFAVRATTATALGVFALCLYVAARPGNAFPHYVLFPVSAWLAVLSVAFAASIERGGAVGMIMAAAVLATALLPARTVIGQLPWIVPARDEASARAGDERDRRIAVAISQHACFPDTMVVWGWMARYHVLTGLPQATRHNMFQRELGFMVPDPERVYYQLFLEDFRRAPPRIFVDAVAPGMFVFTDRASSGHEQFIELADLVARDYTLTDEIDGVRIYVRHGARTGAELGPPGQDPETGARAPTAGMVPALMTKSSPTADRLDGPPEPRGLKSGLADAKYRLSERMWTMP